MISVCLDKNIVFFLSSRTPSIRASEKNVDQYQDLSALGCTLNWLVKNQEMNLIFLKNSNQLKLKLNVLMGS